METIIIIFRRNTRAKGQGKAFPPLCGEKTARYLGMCFSKTRWLLSLPQSWKSISGLRNAGIPLKTAVWPIEFPAVADQVGILY